MVSPSPARSKAEPARWQSELANVLDGFVIRRAGEPDYDRAGLASCRRGLSKKPMTEPAMYQYIAPVSLSVPRHWGAQAQARVEAATHYTLAMYGFHQQSQDRRMHQTFSQHHGPSVGAAASRLHQALKSNTPEGVDRRFLAAMTADSVEEVVGHLRVLVPQLRQHAIPLDYIVLADDLFNWPDSQRRARARRRWGLDYRWVPSDEADKPDSTQSHA
nr:type I-E CRISPR-associated protein Cse2/CasB [Actinomadura oligospora]